MRTNPDIDIDIRDLDVLLDRPKIKVHQSLGRLQLSCVYSKWQLEMEHISLKLGPGRVPNISQCVLQITESDKHFDWCFDSCLCRSAFGAIVPSIAQSALESRKNANFVDAQLQRGLDGSAAAGNLNKLEVCNATSVSRHDYLEIGAVFPSDEQQLEPKADAEWLVYVFVLDIRRCVLAVLVSKLRELCGTGDSEQDHLYESTAEDDSVDDNVWMDSDARLTLFACVMCPREQSDWCSAVWSKV